MSKHTPTPWSVDDTRLGIMAGYQSIAQTFRDRSKTIADREAEAQANAAFIVRACNAHEQLVEALKQTADTLWNLADKFPLGSAVRNTLEDEYKAVMAALKEAA